MSYITYEQLRLESRRLEKSELIKEARASIEQKRIFLSHSHRDREVLGDVIALFKRYSAPVYLDYEDDNLPRITSKQTAIQLREAIRTCPRFVLATSTHIQRSRWTPWELGFADGRKGLPRVALMPLRPSSTDEISVEPPYLIYAVVGRIAASSGHGNGTE